MNPNLSIFMAIKKRVNKEFKTISNNELLPILTTIIEHKAKQEGNEALNTGLVKWLTREGVTKIPAL